MDPAPNNLAATKFIPPEVPPAFVPRPRLSARLDGTRPGAVTVLSGPAGAGKTVLLSDWVARQPRERVAWLAVEAADRDRRRFWRAVLTAVRRSQPAAAPERSAGDPPDVLVDDVVAALAALGDPLTLVLDDVHELGGSRVFADLDRLLEDPPPALRLVVAGRWEPPLRLAPLRTAGRLVELRDADLAFTIEEARELLEGAGAHVRADVAERVWQRTEGWAAGLRLAALRMRAHDDPSRFAADFAGDDRAVADYLLSEVFAQQPPELRAFLLRVSIVDRVCGDLADAMTGREDSGRVLSRLAQEHALLAPIDGARGWWRLHPLFAELLRSELKHDAPDEVAGLHDRAARWLRDEGHGVAALEHAAEAGDWALVAELADTHWTTLLLDGEAGSLRPLLERSPGDLAAADPELALAVAAAHLDAGAVDAALPWLDAAAAARKGLRAERRPVFDLALAALGVLRGRLDGDVAGALAHAHELIERDGGDARELRTLVLAQVGIAELWMGDLHQAGDDLRAACTGAETAGRQWLQLVATAHLVVHALLGGRYDEALRLADDAETVARARGWLRTWPIGVAVGARSAVALHRNEIDEAETELERALELLERCADPPLRAMTALQQGGVLAARGNFEVALRSLGASRRWLRDWPINPPMRELLLSFETTVRAAMGERADAEALLGDLSGPSLETAVASARLALEAGQADVALRALEPHLHEMGASVDFSRTEAWLLTALAHEVRGSRAAAGDALERALGEASVARLRRPFLTKGAAIAPLLERHLRRDTQYRELAEDLLDAAAHPAG